MGFLILLSCIRLKKPNTYQLPKNLLKLALPSPQWLEWFLTRETNCALPPQADDVKQFLWIVLLKVKFRTFVLLSVLMATTMLIR